MELPILYRDDDLVVVHKTAGLLVHRTALDKRAEDFALQIVRDQTGRRVYPVHRLDRPTSGALIFAFSAEVAQKMCSEFAERRVNKEYLAVVRGVPGQSRQRIDYPLKEELDDVADAQARRGKLAQDAVTDIEVVHRIEWPEPVDRYPTSRYALVRAMPLTGRKHQIRRHLRHIGHPIVGDVTHGVGKHNRFFAQKWGIRRLLLACTAISFCHPTRHEPLMVRAPLAEDFARLLEQLGWGSHA